MRFLCGMLRVAAPASEIHCDDRGPDRGAGSSGLAGLGMMALAGSRRRSMLLLNRPGPCIRMSEGIGNRLRTRGPGLPRSRGGQGTRSQPSCAGKGWTRCLPLPFGEGLSTARTTLPIIADLHAGQKTCICRTERSEADPSLDLKNGKVDLVLTSMSHGTKTLGSWSAEGTAIVAAMSGCREEKVVTLLVLLVLFSILDFWDSICRA
jgi:hypothetical protein